ncbi:MAG: SusE domain-containing protein [Bacteroidales bacterium]
MHKIISILSLFIGLFIILSCEQEEVGPVLKKDKYESPASLESLDGDSFELLQEEEEEIMTTFTWEKAEYGVDLAVDYTLQMVKAGEEFTDPVNIATTSKDSIGVKVNDINSKLFLGLGFTPGESHEVDIRVRAIVNEEVDTLYSEPITISVQPYEVEYPKLYVPGSYQDWDPENEETVIYSVDDNDVYSGYLYFPDETTELKLLKVPEWDNDNTIGDPDPSGTSGELQIGDGGGNNIKVEEGPGYFKLEADLNNETYSYLKTEWGIIGSAIGDWETDQDMTYNEEENNWTITIDLEPGELKFRANDDWELDYGDNEGNGTLDEGGDNIEISEAGTYKITLDLSKPPYRYTLEEN